MKPTLKFAFAIIIACAFILNACKKDEEPDPVPATEDEPLTADEAAFLETVPDTFFRLEDIILENGENVRSFLETNDPDFLQTYPSGKVSSAAALAPKQQKLLYLARMYAMGNNLIDDNQHTYPSEGANKPAQTGLAYSWGSKDINRQKPPTVRNPGCNTLEIHGLDCSGMIWQMITAAKLTPPPLPVYNFFVKEITNEAKWTAAFKASADYKDLEMKDMGRNYPQNKMKNGDMILWGKHVGIYLYGSFYQSSGDPNAPGCNTNLSQSRGPHCKSLSSVLASGTLGSYTVFRPVYGADYTMTIALDYTGHPSSLTSSCLLDTYIDSTVINFTVLPDGSVEKNSITNFIPPFTFTDIPPCQCLSVSFLNESVTDYTNFSATTILSLVLLYDLTETTCYGTDIYQCPPSPSVTVPGEVIAGTIDSGSWDLPQEPGESTTTSCNHGWGTGTCALTIIYDE